MRLIGVPDCIYPDRYGSEGSFLEVVAQGQLA